MEALNAARWMPLLQGVAQSVPAVPAYTVNDVDESDPEVPMPGKAGIGFALSA
ncbi:hypothetical protein [Pandoraea sp.]|uniref:hypothetical protein n=1 Tax=Pandoraea sp. TaxID=1883445 RepID=UPI0035AE74C8